MRAGGYLSFDRATARHAVAFLTAAAQTIVRPGQLAGILVTELRRMRVTLPSALVLEAVIRSARARAERLGHEVLVAGLDDATLARLNGLLAVRPHRQAQLAGLASQCAAITGPDQHRPAA